MYVMESSLANAGLYRQTVENIMYSPQEEEKKKEFHDETLASIKKVSKLVGKFESGNLDVTIDEKEATIEEEEKCDSPVFVELPPTPKARTKFGSAVSQSVNREAMRPIRDTAIMNSAPRQVIVRKLFDDEPNVVKSVMTPPRLDFGLQSIIPKAKATSPVLATRDPVVETPILRTSRKVSGLRPVALTETPILRTPSRQVSGISLIDAHIKTSHLDTVESPSINEIGPSRHKTLSSGSSSSESSSSGSEQSKKGSDSSFMSKNQGYSCKLARAQVHSKFTTYFKWNSDALRSIAATVSQMRLDVLNEIPKCNEDERLRNIKTIYENCRRGVNKEMDALCCSLFDLLDDVGERCLSVHEEYVAVKYSKKCQSFE